MKFSELLFILLYLKFFAPPNARLPPLKYFCPTMVCFLVAAPAFYQPIFFFLIV